MNPTLLAAMLGGFIGIVVGWLVRYFVVRLKNYTISGLTSVIAILVAGAVVNYLGPDKSVNAFYAVGLVMGFAAGRWGLLISPP